MAQSFFKITLTNESDPLTEVAPIVLTKNPATIVDNEITYKRHSVYGTVFRNFAESMKFVADKGGIGGYNYLQDAFDTYGIDAIVSIKIETIVLSNKTYEEAYSGIIDFTTYNREYSYINVGLIENNTMAKFFARESIKVNINDTEDLDGEVVTVAPTFEVELPPIKPLLWAEGSGTTPSINNPLTTIPLPSDIIYTRVLSGTSTENIIGNDWSDTLLVYTNNSGEPVNANFYFNMTGYITGQVNITTYSIPPPPDLPPFFQFIFRVYRLDTGAIYKDYDIAIDSLGNFTLDYSIDEDGSIVSTVPNGGSQGFSFAFIISSYGSAAEIAGDFYFNSEIAMPLIGIEINAIEDIEPVTTTAEMYKPLAVGESILKHMGINDSDFECLDFDIGDFELLMMATGKGLRNYPDTPFNLSFRDFFKMYNSILGHLMYFDGDSFIFGNYDSFYDNSIAQLTITEYSNLVYSIANDRYLSSIEIGYNNYDYDYFNGNVEFNTKFAFATVNKNTDNTLSKISDARADSLGIELTKRMQYEDTGGEDTDGDNDIFIISSKIGGSSYFIAKTGLDYTISGVRGGDSFYNYDISPKQNLTRQGFLLNTSLAYKPKISKHVSSKNDIPLVIDGLAELSNDYSTANSGAVKPVYVAFDTVLTTELLTFLNDTPNKMITLSGVCSGFLEEATINLYSKSANIKMIQYS